MMGCTPEIGNRHFVCTLWDNPPRFSIFAICQPVTFMQTSWDLHMFIVYFDILLYIHSFHHIHTVHSSVTPHRWSAQWENLPQPTIARPTELRRTQLGYAATN
jgi:hypothetical protein